MMDFAKVAAFLSEESGVPAEQITPETGLFDLGVDSFKMMDIVLRFEETFGVEISDRQLLSLQTVGDLAALIQ